MPVLSTMKDAITERWKLWLAITVGFVATYYAGMMAGLILRFGKVPNYVIFYDWFGAVAEIIRSTPAVEDMIPIILDEWLVEIGFMNTDFGLGISEWSMTVIPPKVIVAFIAGAMIATGVLLLLRRRTCAATTLNSAGSTVGVGSVLFAISNLTMSWVVCCATPSWIVGLAMLGVGVGTANALEPWGVWLNAGGFLFLTIGVLWLAWLQTARSDAGTKAARSDQAMAGGRS